jgi:EpsI family protein
MESQSVKTSKEFLVSALVLIGTALLLEMVSHGEEVPIKKEFDHFPIRIGPWQGRELGLDPDILKVLKVDDYMMRHYINKEGFPIVLYVGYYGSQRQGSTYHSPRNCLPGSGWSIVGHERIGMKIPGGPSGSAIINKVVIQKGLDKQLILYWYQDRGRIIASEYWAKIYLVWDAMTKNRTDGALVRVSMPLTGDEEAVSEQGRVFIESIFPLLQEYIPS